MLPDDTKARRTQMLEKTLHQTSVNDHFKSTPKEEKLEPYSDELLKQAAIEWLIQTNQVSGHAYIYYINIDCKVIFHF